MTEADVLNLIKMEIEKAGSVAAWARLVGISPSYVFDVMSHRREAGPKILAALNIERHVSYRAKV